MTKHLKMYGLGHCSTCQKARADLAQQGWDVDFRDVKDAPLSKQEWQELIADFSDKLVNRASLTWRGMSPEEREQSPLDMLMAKPSLMKRPAIVQAEKRLLGWTANVKRPLGIDA